MLTDERKAKAQRILARLLEALDESYRDEIERLRLAIRVHQEHSLELIQNNPAVRLSEADYELWEVLGD
jgi:hypothetical protein